MTPTTNKHGCAMSAGLVCVTCGEASPEKCPLDTANKDPEPFCQTIRVLWAEVPP